MDFIVEKNTFQEPIAINEAADTKKRRPVKPLKQRLEEFYGMPWEEILVYIEEHPYEYEEVPWSMSEGEMDKW